MFATLCVTVCYCVYNRAIIRATPQSLRRQSLPKTLPPSLCSGCPQTCCCLFCSAKLSRCVWVYRRSKVAFSHYLQALRGPRRTSNAEDRSVGPVGVELFVTHLITPPPIPSPTGSPFFPSLHPSVQHRVFSISFDPSTHEDKVRNYGRFETSGKSNPATKSYIL